MVVHETYRRADGTWASPAEVTITGEGNARQAVETATGAPVEIGGIEKMSKSKRNTIDPSDIMETYGADTARWFMLSDSPPRPRRHLDRGERRRGLPFRPAYLAPDQRGGEPCAAGPAAG